MGELWPATDCGSQTGFIMKKRKVICVFLALLLSIPLFVTAQETDVKGSKDHPLITRMPNFYIGDYEENEFEIGKFKTDEGTVEIDGRKFEIDYRLKSGVTPSGKAQILRNYENALKSIGAEVMLKGSYYYVFRIIKDGMETWVKVDPGNYDGARYELMIVEREALVQEVTADAAAMKKGIEATGHIAVYGIYFDPGKSEVKTGSEKALTEIAKVLKENAALNLYIVGHTDSDGSLYNNMELSVNRAHAVVESLVSVYGIERSRLEAKGVGELCPVSTNRTTEGKALNRRVELVEKL